MFTFVVDFFVSARTEKKCDPLVWAIWKFAGFLPSTVTCTASIAEMGPGKLIVVTRFPETGMVKTERSSRMNSLIGLAFSAWAICSQQRNGSKILMSRFILKVSNGCRETPVQHHVRVSQKFERKLEWHGFGECLVLKNP